MLDFLTDFVEQLVVAANFDRQAYVFQHHGEPTRYIVHALTGTCECGATCRRCNDELIATDGMWVTIDRRLRLRIEPLDQVVAHPLKVVLERWATS